jgi:hypothetical protein
MRELGRKGGRSRETALRKEVRVDDELRAQSREVLAKALRGEDVPKAALDSARSLFSYRADAPPVEQAREQRAAGGGVFGIADLLRVAVERGILTGTDLRVGGEPVEVDPAAHPRTTPSPREEIEAAHASGYALKSWRASWMRQQRTRLIQGGGSSMERVRFAETPSGWQRSKRWRVPVRWTRRLAIAEEHDWRAERAGATGWYGHEMRAPPALESTPLTPEQIAATYRALRKGREDSKDEPGAADFYYGEMEMRRQGPRATEWPADSDCADEHEGNASFAGGLVGDAGSRPTPRAERLILWLYWLVSGYGLRASRALIALALTVVVFAFLFDLWGFRPDRGYGRTLLFSVESTSSLFRAPETEGAALTPSGSCCRSCCDWPARSSSVSRCCRCAGGSSAEGSPSAITEPQFREAERAARGAGPAP